MRRLIESAFNRLKDFRRIATRYGRLARNYLVPSTGCCHCGGVRSRDPTHSQQLEPGHPEHLAHKPVTSHPPALSSVGLGWESPRASREPAISELLSWHSAGEYGWPPRMQTI